jgi:hypothetical protein
VIVGIMFLEKGTHINGDNGIVEESGKKYSVERP